MIPALFGLHGGGDKFLIYTITLLFTNHGPLCIFRYWKPYGLNFQFQMFDLQQIFSMQSSNSRPRTGKRLNFVNNTFAREFK